MAENSEKREGYPDRKTAEAMLAEAEKIDPGPWGNHCRVAAYAAEKIALSCGMNGEKAYVLGLLHDIGRKFFVRDLGHIYNGYRYMQSLGYFAVAKICLTHSFPNRDLDIIHRQNRYTRKRGARSTPIAGRSGIRRLRQADPTLRRFGWQRGDSGRGRTHGGRKTALRKLSAGAMG